MKAWISYAAWLFVSSCILHAQEYDVVFHRNAVAGHKAVFQIKFNVDDDQEFKIDGKALPTNVHVKLAADLTVQSEVVAVDKNGYVTEQKLTVKFCQCTKDGATTDLFKPQDEIVIKNETPRQFTVLGKPASPLQKTTLDQVFSNGADDPGADDRVFNPGHKVKVGESWLIHAEEAAAGLSKKLGSTLSKDAVKGNVKLDAANPKNGIPCLQLAGELQLDAGGLPLPGAPPEIKAKKFDTSFTMKGDFPIDPKVEQQSENIKMISTAEGGGTMQNGTEVTFKLTKTQTKEITILAP